ncbi:TonB-dependent receptor [Dokdonella sp.]|uniref:TonB-dependent receptor n=1 Tax=Dokdonella sp. TaxID=2291710 RepID=UPI001B2E87D8|nr:TonB-dependent receptor [Dokdonella sp.]MBO9661943.1 TonB-dependent receptor [Dokdonella sp.]
MKPHRFKPLAGLTGLALLGICMAPVAAQERGGDDTQVLQAIEVTGSRIKKAEVESQTPILTITSKDIEATGLGSIGDVIQRLSVSGSSLNTKFNSAGNFGFPPDGGGVGSGSTTISLRNLGAKRTLVLVDGLRWINESSASGVSAAVDLNTIPASVVDRIEILKDGASSLYGSDAIAGVINIITKKKDKGLGLHLYGGDYSTGDGKTWSGNVSFGASTDKFDFFADVSHYKQNRINSSDWTQSKYAIPGVGSAPNRGWSSYTPFGRIDFSVPGGGDFGGLCPDGVCDITANGVAGPGGLQRFPDGYHGFSTADRFNYAQYNLLLTPQKRTGFFAQGTYHITDHVNFYVKGLYNERDSTNQAAPEPIGLGQGFCAALDLCYRVGVDVSNPYNPFGFSLSADDPNFGIGRRPIEGGPRVYKQTVDTNYYAAGLNGDFSVGERQFFWDVNYVNSTNKAKQTVTGTYNIRHIMNALGPVDLCTAPCVPMNIFGGPGTLTREMLDYILFTERDRSRQELEVWTANVSGSLFQLPAGSLDVAAGYEHRKLDGSYSPDPIVVAGDSNGVPSRPTKGGYSVNEYYLELNVPLLADMSFAKHLDLSVASRYSDYSNFGNTTNNKFGLRWQLVDDLTLRGTYAEGFRAPSIGELYGTFSRFDAQLVDPCSGNVTPNCTALGVPPGYEQANPQISVITGGNRNLKPEESKSTTLGAIYSPGWAENTAWSQRLDFEFTYYKIKVDNAIQAPNAQTQLNRCVGTTDPLFCNGITRAQNGAINGFNNTLRNLGRIDTSGFDLGLNWLSPETTIGHFGANWQITYTKEYKSVANDTGAAEPTRVGVEVADSGIPRIKSTLTTSWGIAAWNVSWTLRYLSKLTEDCGNATSFPICTDPENVFGGRSNGTHTLGATTYHDARVSWKVPVRYDFSVSAGINNIFGKDAPVCLSCSLNGYDASSYDLPGRFSYVEASVKF